MRVLNDGEISWILGSHGLRNPPPPNAQKHYRVHKKELKKRDPPQRGLGLTCRSDAFSLPKPDNAPVDSASGECCLESRDLLKTEVVFPMVREHMLFC